MSWDTIYISGKPGFKKEVLQHLESADLPVMPGSTGNEQDVMLFWIEDTLPLRSLKKAIGSKVVFKYRLQFFSTLEEWQHRQDKLSSAKAAEETVIRDIKAWHSTQNYLHSA